MDVDVWVPAQTNQLIFNSLPPCERVLVRACDL